MANIYSIPSQEPLFDGFTVRADGENVPVRLARVSAVPFNRRWPGHQRQINQSEPAGFVSFASDGPVRMRVECAANAAGSALVRPLSKNVVPEITGNAAEFTLTEPGGYTFEAGGFHNALHIFFDPAKPQRAAADIFFGPGVHRPGLIELRSGQTLCIAEGAVVYACVSARDAENITITGRGLLDNSENREELLFVPEKLGDGSMDVGNSVRRHTIELVRCKNVRIEDITIRDSLVYNICAHGCEDAEVDNVKIIGCWRYNSDGIDFHNSSRVRIRNCFLRTFDDGICVKGHDGYADLCEDITVENCVVWCDWDHALEIGAETRAEHMRNIVFRNCDVIRNRGVAIDIYNVDYGDVHDVLFEDIRVEYDDRSPRPMIQKDDAEDYSDPGGDYMPQLVSFIIAKHPEYSEGRDRRGHIRGVTVKNVSLYAPALPPSEIHGFDAEHPVRDIRLEGLTLNGRPAKWRAGVSRAENISIL